MRTGLWTILALATSAAAADAGDWPRFRGENIDGISREKGLLRTWPEDGPKVLWKATLGAGYSGLSVADGRLFTMFDRGDDELAAAFDAATGEQLWTVRTDRAWEDGMGDGPRTTPTVDGDHVYTISARGTIYCLRAEDGEVIWKRDLVETLGAKLPRWGVSTSPLIEGGLVLLDVGGDDDRSLAGLDKKTGEVIWTAEEDKPGYAAPIAVTIDDVRQAIFFTGTQLVAVDPKTGRRLWRSPWKTDWDVNAATPIFVSPDKLFVSSGYDTGSALLQIRMKKVGSGAVEKLWSSRAMKNQFSSSVIVRNHAYGFDDKTLKAINVHTGEEAWRERGLGHGSLLWADGHLIVLGESGRLVLVEATPEAYRAKSSVQILDGKCWTVPTLSGGRLYVRNEKELLCLDVSE